MEGRCLIEDFIKYKKPVLEIGNGGGEVSGDGAAESSGRNGFFW